MRAEAFIRLGESCLLQALPDQPTPLAVAFSHPRAEIVTFQNTYVTLTALHLAVMLPAMAQKSKKPGKRTRPPRIRVPNNERALFTVDTNKFVGVIRRLSLTGGSAVLSKGPILQGTLAQMDLITVFGKVTAQIEFMHSGADGIPLAQAFRFLDMDDVSSERFSTAASAFIGTNPEALVPSCPSERSPGPTSKPRIACPLN